MLSSASSLPTWHVSCIPQRVLVDKLESGFLLFETQQGLMRVDPSFGQRVRLLWTFRNFRQLSVPLLNPRERALVNQLFWRNVGFVPHIDELTPIIGVVEKFTPPPIPREILDGDLIVAQILPTEPKKPKRQKVRRQDRKPVISFDLRRHLVSYRSVLSSDGKDLTASWSKRFTNVAANIRSLKSAVLRLSAKKPSLRINWPRIASIGGALALCALTAVAYRRMQHTPSSLASIHARVHVPSESEVLPPPASIPSPANEAIVNASRIAPIAQPLPDVEPLPITKASTKTPTKSRQKLASAKLRTSSDLSRHSTSVHRVEATPRPSPQFGDEILASRAPLRIIYPDHPKVRGRSVVTLQALVDASGKVRSVRIISGQRALAAAAVKAVRLWSYRPFLKNGQPVATETNIVMSFISSDAISMNFPPTINTSTNQ